MRGGRLPWATFAALLSACAGTETGNPSFDGELAYDAYSSQASVAALREGDSGAVIEQAWLVLGDVELLDPAHCDAPSPDAPHAEGLGAGDHAVAGAARSPFRAAIGKYCGLAVPFLRAAQDALPSGAPAALAHHSILLTGRLPARGDLPFEVQSTYDAALVLGAEADGFDLGPDQSSLLLTFDLARWLSVLPLDTLEPGDDGVVRISPATQPELSQAFDAAIASGVELRADPAETGLAEQAGEPLARARD